MVLLHETNEDNLHDKERDIKTVIMEAMDSHAFMNAWHGEERIPRVLMYVRASSRLSTGSRPVSI